MSEMRQLDFNMRQIVVRAYNAGSTVDELYAELVKYNRITNNRIPSRDVVRSIYEEMQNERSANHS